MQKIVIVNFKAYVSGKKAVELARSLKTKKVNLMIAVQNVDLYRISSLNIKVLAQHVDNIDIGAFTGKVLAEGIKQSNAYGVLLNHSEDRLNFNVLKKTVKKCKEVGLKTIVCCANLFEAKKILKLNVDYLAFEVPELIGTGRSISRVKPESVRKFVKIVGKKSVPLCGAGVTTNEDFKATLSLGCKGVLLASRIVKTKDPGKALKELIS